MARKFVSTSTWVETTTAAARAPLTGAITRQAIKRFDRVIVDKSTRADGAMYWKAYSLYKLGRKPEAQTVLADLEKQFPQSRWLNDARSLAAEVRASNGQPNSPESESDEELKLLAMNSLMQQDADRAIPLLEKVLADPKNSPEPEGPRDLRAGAKQVAQGAGRL